jgi:hypothetical protein
MSQRASEALKDDEGQSMENGRERQIEAPKSS